MSWRKLGASQRDFPVCRRVCGGLCDRGRARSQLGLWALALPVVLAVVAVPLGEAQE
jgi:hypothetical protein